MAVVLPGNRLADLFHTPSPVDRNKRSFETKRQFEGLHVSRSSIPAGELPKDRVSISETASDQPTADKQLNDYVSLIAQLNNPDEKLQRFIQEAQKLFSQVEALSDFSSESIQSLSVDAQAFGELDFAAAVVDEGAVQSASAAIVVRTEVEVSGEIQLKNGQVVRFESRASVQISAAVLFRQEAPAPPEQVSDPLALDLDGNGQISLSDVEHGVHFDINADGILDQSAFVRGGDGFLAYDRNHNGYIDNGGELFGDQHGAANGFLELARFDEDGNGAIDHNDTVFSELSVIRQAKNGAFEQISLAKLGVTSLGLKNQSVNLSAEGGNRLTQLGSYQGANGEQRTADVLLRFQSLSTDA